MAEKQAMLGMVPITTPGQVIYLALMAAPDGLDTLQVAAIAEERFPDIGYGVYVARMLQMREIGYIRYDAGRWYAPGPINPVLEVL